MRRHEFAVSLAALMAASGLLLGGCLATDNELAAHNAENQAQFAAQDSRMDQLSSDSQAALARAEAAHKLATGDFQHAVLYTDDTVRFDTGSSSLSADAQASLAAFATRVKTDNKDVMIEIEGHADSRGAEDSNKALASARADAAMAYLHDQGIPLSRMDAISYGEAKAGMTTEAEDRRVSLIVLQ
jgi:peptidoglycan-associated lipoprotein